MLKLPSPDTVRVELGEGAVAILSPIDSVAWMNAQSASRLVSLASEEGDFNPVRYALIASLVHEGLVELEGVADVDGALIEGKPSEEQIDRLLAWYPAYDRFESDYAGPLLRAQSEKNGSAPSRSGSSTPRAATDTAAAATPNGTGDRSDAENAPAD